MEPITIWTAVGALATVTAAFGIFFAGRQLRFAAWAKTQEIFVEEKFVKARGRVFKHLQQPTLEWNVEAQDAGFQVCRRMDEVCRLAPYFAFTPWTAQKTFLEVFDDPLAKSWAPLQPLVIAERDMVGWKTKWDSFEKLGGAALNRLPREKREDLNKTSTRLGPQIKLLRRQT